MASEGWARGNLTRLPRPVSPWSATALAGTSAHFGRALSVSHHLPSLGRLPLRVVRSSVAFLVTTLRWPPVRCVARLVFVWGAVPPEDRHLGALKVVFCPQAHAGHFREQIGGDCNAIVGAWAAGACSRSSPIQGRRGSWGHLPYTPTSQTSGTASARAGLVRLSLQVSRLGVFLHRTARGTASRLQRLEDSSEDHPAGKYVPNSRSRKRAATPRSSGQKSMYLLLPDSVQWLHLGSGCRPTARTSSRRTWLVLDQRPPHWNGADHSLSRGSGRAGPL